MLAPEAGELSIYLKGDLAGILTLAQNNALPQRVPPTSLESGRIPSILAMAVRANRGGHTTKRLCPVG